MDERYFGLHHDLMPEAIALQLHGTLVWEREDEGMWIALIRFNRQFEQGLRCRVIRARTFPRAKVR